MPINDLNNSALAKAAPGVVGAAVSMAFLPGRWPQKLFMLAAGSSLSYFAVSPVAAWLGAESAEGLIGFLVGLFGMALASKAHEVIQALDARKLADAVSDWLKRKWRV